MDRTKQLTGALMKVEQAVFASADNSLMKGYQLVARSAGVDRVMAQELCRWAPSHAALASEGADVWSLNYFPIDDRHVALARTMYGGAEYSARGGRQVVTLYLVAPRYGFLRYENNAVTLARTAMALGHLRLPRDLLEHGETVKLPDQPLPMRPRGANSTFQADPASSLAAALQSLQDRRRVAVIGDRDPLGLLETLLGRLPLDERPEFSFSTGLSWSMRRAFHLQFLPDIDTATRQKFAAHDIVCIAAA